MPSGGCAPSSPPSPTASTASHDVIENDGIEAKPYTVAIDLYVQGDELVADYSRSSPQAQGPDQRHARVSPPVPSTTACCT